MLGSLGGIGLLGGSGLGLIIATAVAESPRHREDTIISAGEFLEQRLGKIERAVVTSGALVSDLCGVTIAPLADGNHLEAVGTRVTTAELRRVQGHNLVTRVVVNTTRAKASKVVRRRTAEALLVHVHVLRAFDNVAMVGLGVQVVRVVCRNDSKERGCADGERVESQHVKECAESECGR